MAESTIGTVIDSLTPEIMCPQATESCPKNVALHNWCNKPEMNASKYWLEGVETCQVSPSMSSISVDITLMKSLFDELRDQCNSTDSEADVAEGWDFFNCNSKKGICKHQ